MKTKTSVIAAASLLLACSAASAAPAIIATTEPMGNQTAIAFDFVADKQPVTALMIEMKLAPGTSAKALGMDKCLAQVASTHTGGCSVKANGNFAFLIYGAGRNVALGSGPIGTIMVPTAALGGSINFPFVEFTLPDSTTVAGNLVVDSKSFKRKGFDKSSAK